MKKRFIALLAACTIVVLTACNNTKNKDTEDTAAQTSTEASQSSTKAEEITSVFTGVLAEDAVKNDEGEETVRLLIKEVKAVEDPENILPMMQNDGVVLNVTEEQWAENTKNEELKAGDSVQFTMTGLPVMTMSIPPQLAGNALQTVEKI